MTMKVLRREADGVVYSNPADRGNTVRFKFGSAAKNLAGMPTTNHTTEIIVNDDVSVVVNGVPAIDALSVRIRTSCSKEAQPRLKQVLLAVAAQLPDWTDEDVFVGFAPETVPNIPAPV